MEKRSKYKLKVAVVILNYNGIQHLQNHLASVRENLPDNVQLVVADNGSTDGSVAYLQSEHPGIHLVELSENTGYAGGYNNALTQIESEYFFLLNSDVEIAPNCIKPLVDFLDQNPYYAACQPKVRSMTNRDEFEYAGACGGWLDRFGYPLCRGRILSTNEKDTGQYDQVEKIFWATGAAMMIRSQNFHFIGGFDADFFAHMEEIDLCWRLQRTGWHIAVVPESVVYHLGGGTLEYTSPKKTYLNFRNSLYILIKNERGHVLLWLLLIRLMLDGIAGIRFILLSDFRNFAAVIRAHFHFYQAFPKMWKKRKSFLQFLATNQIEERIALDGRYHGSIVWDYYIMQRKTFSELNINETREKQLSENL